MKDNTILIVDDDGGNRRLLEALVTKAGYPCETVADGGAALAVVREREPGLILLDVMMPGMDGYEVTRHLKADPRTSGIPIILLTALNDQESRLKGLEAGAEEFLTKPVDRLELEVRLRNLMRLKEYSDFIEDHNRLLKDEVRARTLELLETRLEIIRALGRAAEFRDNETGLHILRMSQYAQLLGQGMGMSDDEAEMLLNATPMHDIGKVGIPDHILLKPGKLAEDEWAIMRRHTLIGADILASAKPSPLLDLARAIALSHHERWDGGGYPHGLVGEQIPLAVRIVSLADVFDALTSERPYKGVWSMAQTLAEIKRLSGRHFEPRLVEVFLERLPEIVAIRQRHLDLPAGVEEAADRR